jgi:hypothetical protein
VTAAAGPEPPAPPDRLDALRDLVAGDGAELAALDAVVRGLRAADPAGDVTIDPVAAWRRLESLLDGAGRSPDESGA